MLLTLLKANVPTQPTIVGSVVNTEGGASASTLTFTLPTDSTKPAAGDWFILFHTHVSGGALTSASGRPSYPGGWTAPIATSAGTMGSHLAFGQATGSESTTYQFTLASAVQSNSVLMWIRGADTNSPPLAGAWTGRLDSGQTNQNWATGMAVPNDNSLVLAWSYEKTSATTGETVAPTVSGAPGGYTQYKWLQQNAAQSTIDLIDWYPGTAATSSQVTFTYPNTSTNNGIAGQIAFAPVGATNADAYVNLSGSGTLAATVLPDVPSAVALSGSGSLGIAPPLPAPSAASALSGSGTLSTGSNIPNATRTAALSGSGSLVAWAPVAPTLTQSWDGGTGAADTVAISAANTNGSGQTPISSVNNTGGSTSTFSATNTHSPGLALCINEPSGGLVQAQWNVSSTVGTRLVHRIYFYLTQNTAGTAWAISVLYTSGVVQIAGLYVTANNTFGFGRSGVQDSGFSVALNTWYRLETGVSVQSTAAAGTVDLAIFAGSNVDGAVPDYYSGQVSDTSIGTLAAAIARVGGGTATVGFGRTYYIDDWGYNPAVPIGYLTPASTNPVTSVALSGSGSLSIAAPTPNANKSVALSGSGTLSPGTPVAALNDTYPYSFGFEPAYSTLYDFESGIGAFTAVANAQAPTAVTAPAGAPSGTNAMKVTASGTGASVRVQVPMVSTTASASSPVYSRLSFSYYVPSGQSSTPSNVIVGNANTFTTAAVGGTDTWLTYTALNGLAGGRSAADLYAVTGFSFGSTPASGVFGYIDSLTADEIGYGGWTVSGTNTTASISASTKHTGTYAAQVFSSSSPTITMARTFTGMTVGQTYTFSVWAQASGGGTVVLSVPGVGSNSVGITGTFSQVSYTFTATSTSHTLQLDETQTSGNANVYYDDFSVAVGALNYTASPALSGSGTLGTTQTPSIAVTAAFSGSGSLGIASPVAAAVASPSLSGSGALTTSVGAPNLSVAPALSGSGALTTSGTPRPTQTVALSGTGTLAYSGTPAISPIIALSGSGVLSVSQASLTVAANLSGTGALSTGAGIPNLTQSVALSGSGTLSTGTSTPAVISTLALSGSGTLSTARTITASGTATLSGSGALTSAATVSASGTATLSGTGTLATSQTVTTSGAATLSGFGTLTSSALPNPTVATALSGSGTLAAAVTPNPQVSTALSGSGALTTSGSPVALVTPNLSGSGTLATSTRTPALLVTPALSGSGVLATTTAVTASGAATLSGSGVLAYATAGSSSSNPALSGSGTLSTTTSLTASGIATLSGSGTLAATPSVSFARTATLSGSGTLSTSAVPVASVSLALSGAGTLSTVRTLAIATATAFSGSGALTTATTGSGAATPVLSGSGTLVATGTPNLLVTAALSGSGTLAATPTITTAATATLSGSGTISTTATPFPATSVSLSGSGTLTAVGQNSSINTATLSGSGALSTTVIPAPIRSASLSGTGALTVVPSISTAGSATLSGSGALAATGIIGYSSTATLSGSGTLAASGTYVVNLVAALSGSGQLAAGGSQNLRPTVSLSGTGTLFGLPQNQVVAFPQFSGVGILRVAATPGWNAAGTFSGSGTLNASGHPYRFAHFAILDTSNNAFRVVGERHSLAADGRNASVSAAGRNSGVSVTTKANPFIARTK